MTTTPKTAPKPPNCETAKRLLTEALKQPGIRELAEVYEAYRIYGEAAAAYRTALCPEPIEWASSSTAATSK